MSYVIKLADSTPDISARFDSAGWSAIPVMTIGCTRPEGSGHTPQTELKLQYNAEGIYGIFHVHDRYVKCIATCPNDPVCLDSCVEFFVQPASGTGYNNFEFNAIGTMLAMHVNDHHRSDGQFAQARFLTQTECTGVQVATTLSKPILEEIQHPINYEVGFFIPFQLFGETNQAPRPVRGTVWRANAFKCGDNTSHPHWLSWHSVPSLNFHLPDRFGRLIFG